MTIEERIKSRGYMAVVIKPTDYVEERVQNLPDLFPILQKISVSYRGWDFPHTGNERPSVFLHHIEAATDWTQFKEIYRFYQSGQFAHLSGYFLDWMDEGVHFQTPPGWKPGEQCGLGDTVARFTEIYEFASRLAQTPAGGEEMEIKIVLNGLKNRRLTNDDPSGMPLVREYRASINEYPHTEKVKKVDLLTRSSELALNAASKVFQRFGMDPRMELLKGIQQKVMK